MRFVILPDPYYCQNQGHSIHWDSWSKCLGKFYGAYVEDAKRIPWGPSLEICLGEFPTLSTPLQTNYYCLLYCLAFHHWCYVATAERGAQRKDLQTLQEYGSQQIPVQACETLDSLPDKIQKNNTIIACTSTKCPSKKYMEKCEQSGKLSKYLMQMPVVIILLLQLKDLIKSKCQKNEIIPSAAEEINFSYFQILSFKTI